MTRKKPPSVRNVILCDLIRQENTGKHILIGVYGDALIFPSFPANIILSLYCEIDNVVAGKLNVSLRVNLGDEVVNRFVAELWVNNDGSLQLALPPVQISVPAPSTLRFEISFDGENWTELLARPLRGPTLEELSRMPHQPEIVQGSIPA